MWYWYKNSQMTDKPERKNPESLLHTHWSFRFLSVMRLQSGGGGGGGREKEDYLQKHAGWIDYPHRGKLDPFLIPANVPGRWQLLAQGPGSYHPGGKPRWNCWLLDSALLSPRCYSHMRDGAADEDLCLSLRVTPQKWSNQDWNQCLHHRPEMVANIKCMW